LLQDGTQWKCPLWFCDHDRFTGEHFVFRVDALLGSDYDPAFLEANVVDPLATSRRCRSCLNGSGRMSLRLSPNPSQELRRSISTSPHRTRCLSRSPSMASSWSSEGPAGAEPASNKGANRMTYRIAATPGSAADFHNGPFLAIWRRASVGGSAFAGRLAAQFPQQCRCAAECVAEVLGQLVD
jgi:hypothetical protein